MPASDVTVSAEFEDADTIYIVGDFNLWDATDPSCVMTKNSDGKYVITKELEGGIRRFKIVKNGSWDSSLGIGEETLLSNGVAAALVEGGIDAHIELTSATAVTFLFDPVAMTVTVSWDEAGEEPDDATYSIVGSFNGWDVRDTSYTMALNSDGKYVIAAELEGGNYEFKIAKNYSLEDNLGISDTEDAISNGETAALVENGVNSLYFELAGTSEVTFVFDPVAMTITVSWEEYVPTLFEVIIADTQNGSVSASPDFTIPGDTVILTVTPDEGFEIDTISCNDGTDDIEIIATGDVYSFTMPASDVTVSASFNAVETAPTEPTYAYNLQNISDFMFAVSCVNDSHEVPSEYNFYPPGFATNGEVVKDDEGRWTCDVTVRVKAMFEENMFKGVSFSGHRAVNEFPESQVYTAIWNSETEKWEWEGDTVIYEVTCATDNRPAAPTENNDISTELLRFSCQEDESHVKVVNIDSAYATVGEVTENADGEYTCELTWNVKAAWEGSYGADFASSFDAHAPAVALPESKVFSLKYDTESGKWTYSGETASYSVTCATYSVTVADTENGTVEVDKTEAIEGDTVTLTVTPNEGYEIDTISYNDGTTDHEVTATEGVYSFTMPAEHITITATFKSAASQGNYSGGDGTKENPYILSTVEDMLAFHEAISNDDGSLDNIDTCGLGMYHGYYFELGNNIDMSGVEWSPVSFCGNLDGKGFTISNLSVTEANNGSDEYWAAMFAQLINATVSNITFENCSASISDEVSSSRDIYVAITAANAIASKLENIRVVDCSVTQNGSAYNFSYAAFVAAIADISNITGCIVEGGEISANDTSSNSVFAGGITGCFEDLYYEFIADYGNPYNMVIGAGADYGIYDCYVNADITVTAGASSHVAGITGMTMTDFLDETAEFNGKAVEIENCVYDGTLTAVNSTVGGITGWDENEDHIVDCVSHATVSAAKTFPLGELPETVTNSYYLSETETEDGGKTEAQFASGEVCTARGGHFEVDEVCVICGYTESVTTYTVTISDTIENGTVEADVAEAAEGDTVTLTITPDDGYEIDTVSYNDGTTDHEVTATEGVYSFTMPANNVTVTATFKKAIHTHPVCGATHTDIGDHKGECEAIEWTAWNGDETILDSGYYYLTGDVNASVIVADGRDVHICLNGYTLDGSGESTVFVANNGSFTLTDCVGTGKLTGGTGTVQWSGETKGGGIYSEFDGIVTVYGGSITGNSADYMGAGIYSGGNLYLYGGSVAGNSFNNEEAKTIDKSQVYASNLYLYGGSFDSVRGDNITLGGSPEISGFLRTNGSFLKISGELTNTTPIPLLCGESLYGDDTVQIGSGYGGYVDRFEAYEQHAEIKNENGELVYLCPIRVVFRSNDGSGIIYEETLPATGGKLTSIPELPAKKGYAPFWYSYTDGAPTPSTETVYAKSAEYIGAYEPYTIELEELPNGYRVSSPNGTVKEDGIAWHKATKTTAAVNLDNAEPYAYDGDSSSYENGKWVPLYGYYFITNLKARDVLIITPDDMSNFAAPRLWNDTSFGLLEHIVHDSFVEFKIKEDGQYTLYSYDSDYVSSTTPVSAEVNTYEIGEAIEGETSDIFSNGTNGEYYNVRMVLTDGTVLEEVFEYDIPIPAFLTLGINLERDSGKDPVIDTETGYTSLGKLTIKNSEGKIAAENLENQMSYGENLAGKAMLTTYIEGISAGDYTIIFEKPGYCTLEQSITVGEGDNEIILTPVCGDIRGSYEETVGDGIVDIDDFIRVLRGFDSEAPALLSASVDLNEDGVVNVADLAIIKAAMTKASE